MNKQLNLAIDRLRYLLAYDALTGQFTYKVPRGHRRKVGDSAGGKDASGYLVVVIDDVKFKAHRLAWFYAYGTWPEGQLDHINGNKLDNCLANLREVSPRTNTENKRCAPRNSSTRLLGVHKSNNTSDKKWKAAIRVFGKIKHLGYFYTPEEAHEAYLRAKRLWHAGCTI